MMNLKAAPNAIFYVYFPGTQLPLFLALEATNMWSLMYQFSRSVVTDSLRPH